VEALKKCDVSSGVYGGVVCDIISKLSDFDLYDFFFLFVEVVIVWFMKLLTLLFLCLSTNCGSTLFLVLYHFVSKMTIVILAFNETRISFKIYIGEFMVSEPRVSRERVQSLR
jgi:hypothetical protein